MEDLHKKLEVTEDKRKQINKVLFTGKLQTIKASIIFGLGLFASNLVSIYIGKLILKDVNPNMQIAFQFVSIGVNMIFMARYYNGQVEKNGDIMISKIKEILKDEK